MKIVEICNKIIEFSFYGIFFLVPLVFSSQTSELFEFNKMWLTFGLTILVLSSWIIKMIVLKKFWVQKTLLDIPIALFLASQTVSIIFSLDPYVSLWGFYSRFNGGLLSILSYVVLYYAFVSNFSLARGPLVTGTGPRAIIMAKRLLGVSLISGAIVALWGLPSHFGYDPTCFLFRRSFDVSCWTSDFQPKLRMFSTLGQPDWLGAYLAILSPLVLAFMLNSKRKLFAIGYMLLSILFYTDILFTKSRASLIAFWVAELFFLVSFYWFEFNHKLKGIDFKSVKPSLKLLVPVLLAMILISAVVLRPTLSNKTSDKVGTFSSGGGGTESGKIRLLVWEGALKIWTHYPLFGSGVETFAFSYYKYRPVAHNLTSEWNYLYNKAHNEFLNYLATTGLAGFAAYLSIIITFIVLSIKYLVSCSKRKIHNTNYIILATSLLAGYLSILVTNFFGFSVVIVNIYLFLIPVFVFILLEMINEKRILLRSFSHPSFRLSFLQKIDILVVFIVTFYLLAFLVNFWLADKAYSEGSNLQRSGQYDRAYLNLQEAVSRVGFEPTFKDELASNDSILAISLLSQMGKDEKTASKEGELAQSLAREAIVSTSQVTAEHPNNVVFWKTKVRVFYTLSQVDPRYTNFALDAIKKAQELAPTDANVAYNLGLLYGQSGDTKKAIDALKQAVKLKPNYSNAHYGLGLFYRQLATNDKGKVTDDELNQKAIEEMDYILKNIDSNFQDAKDALKLWSGAQ